ncbi:MAG: hypothetical protein AAGA56_11645 [Myxococcota bacterium]
MLDLDDHLEPIEATTWAEMPGLRLYCPNGLEGEGIDPETVADGALCREMADFDGGTWRPLAIAGGAGSDWVMLLANALTTTTVIMLN